ncbi:MAG: hypothetical protein WA160_08455 [Pseudobdellovibrio sp.]
MSKVSAFFIVFLLFLFSCSSQPHKLEVSPIRLASGATQVKIKLHDKDKAIPGLLVNAFAKNCTESLSARGLIRRTCTTIVLGQGKVIEVSEDKLSLVEFDASVKIDEFTLFEAIK